MDDFSIIVRERDEIIAEKTAQDIKVKALALTIVDSSGFDDALNFMNDANAIYKRIEEFRKSKVKPLHDAEKEINKTCKAVSIPLDEAVRALARKTSDWKQAELDAQRKVEEANRKKIEKAQVKAEETGTFKMPTNLKPIQEVQTTARSETGTATFKEVWDYEVLAVDALPDQFVVKEPNKRAIRAAVDGGVRAIPGVKIFKTMQVIKRGA